MAPYKYKSLGNVDGRIRLLDLLPGSGPVKCRLQHVSLTKIKEKYEALSYFWGTPTDYATITIDDSALPVRPSLHAALRRLRPSNGNSPRSLWIDAICINQDDDKEKNSQVRLMGQIYSSCVRVVIWIGEHDSLTRFAFKAVRFMASKWETGEKFNYYDWKEVQRREKQNGLRRGQSPKNLLDKVASGAAISSVFSRPWFQRVWVIQETVLPPYAVVVCGKFQIEWDLIAKAQEISKTNFDVNSHLSTMLHFRHWPKGIDEDIFCHMIMAWNQDATKRKDKIYGLMGIKSSDEEDYIDIDYEKSDEEVFIDFTRGYLARTRKLDVLAICRGCRADDPQQENYPSWAINFQNEEEKDPQPSGLISWGFVRWEAYPRGLSAGGSVRCNPVFVGNLLQLQGVQFDSVAVLSPANSPGSAAYQQADRRANHLLTTATVFYSIYIKNGIHSWQSAISFCQFYLAARKMCAEAQLGDTYRSTGQTTLDAFWQVIRGRNLPLDHKDAAADTRKQFEDFDKFLSRQADQATTVRSIVSIIHSMLTTASVMELFPQVGLTRHRRFFITKKGYMGLGPRESRVGDSVIVLQGHPAPILARAATEKNHWRVVGDSYIHGIMEGEAFAEQNCQPLWFK